MVKRIGRLIRSVICTNNQTEEWINLSYRVSCESHSPLTKEGGSAYGDPGRLGVCGETVAQQRSDRSNCRLPTRPRGQPMQVLDPQHGGRVGLRLPGGLLAEGHGLVH